MTNPTGKTVLFRMNGVSYAFMREIGCVNCPQCSADKPRANTSGALIIQSEWASHRQTEHVLLFDCGAGVVDSLIDFGVTAVSHVFVSHNHIDHYATLHALNAGQRRSGGASFEAIYATPGTFANGPGKLFHWLEDLHQPVMPGRTLHLGLGINLQVTPVAVYHGPYAYEPVNWVVEFGHRDAGTYRKLLLCWDLLHLVPRYAPEDADAHYDGAMTDADDLNDTHVELLRGADELFIDSNTVTPQPQSGHTSVDAALRFYIPQMKPKRTWFVHYSGHEDPFGPLSDDGLQAWLDTHKGDYALPDADLRVAQHGMTLVYGV